MTALSSGHRSLTVAKCNSPLDNACIPTNRRTRQPEASHGAADVSDSMMLSRSLVRSSGLENTVARRISKPASEDRIATKAGTNCCQSRHRPSFLPRYVAFGEMARLKSRSVFTVSMLGMPWGLYEHRGLGLLADVGRPRESWSRGGHARTSWTQTGALAVA